MIKLYRQQDSPAADKLEAALKELVLAHQVIVVNSGAASADLPPNTPLPALNDNGQIIAGAEQLKFHLARLEQITYEWHTYQGDACYILDDDGSCL